MIFIIHKEGGDKMSKPEAPYYHKLDSDVYHWEMSCSLNHYPDPGWEKTDEKPPGKEQCDQCKGK